MKKIININLSGRVIPIEDSAYEKLQAYIESLRRYFFQEEGRDEIINDIESRIAELLHDKVRKGAPAITDEDVDGIIASMGRPEDFGDEETETAAKTEGPQTTQTKRTKGRLYRDTSDKFIGGVCSGIASYLNVDPAIVRILFAIVTFGGFGLGFVIYILLWMILPPKDLEGFTGKRLFRNPDDRIIGGVAGGLAAYFNRSSSTIRLIFVAPFLLSILINILRGFTWHYDFDLFPNILIGSLGGTFFIAYIILWMVLPEARSPYEKMEMRGEKVDVQSIKQNVQEGVENMKERVKTWGDEVKDSAQNFSNKAKEFGRTRGKQFASEVGEVARTGGSGLGHAIGVLFKVFFLFIAGTIAFGLFVAVIALIFGGVGWWPINDFLWTSKAQQLYAWATVIFFLGVPLIGFIFWVIRKILNVKSRNNYLSWSFGFLWTLGWVAMIIFVTSLLRDFREYEHTDQPVSIMQPSKGKLIVAVSQPELDYTGNFGWMDTNNETGWDISKDSLKLSTIRFNIKASQDSLYHVVLRRYSFGRSEEEALARAGKINYMVYSIDSVLDLSNGYAIDKDSKFRGQQIEIEIHVPIGRMIRFDQSVEDKLQPVEVTFRRRFNRNVRVEIDDDYWRQFKPNVDYVMGVDGNLKDSSGKSIFEDFRYSEDSVNLDQEIQQKELEIQKLKERKKQQAQPVSMDEESMNDGDVTSTTASTSGINIISLANWFN